MREVGRIEWEYSGTADLAVGTGATASEKLVVYGSSLIAACVFLPLWFWKYKGWDWWIYIICANLRLRHCGWSRGERDQFL